MAVFQQVLINKKFTPPESHLNEIMRQQLEVAKKQHPDEGLKHSVSFRHQPRGDHQEFLVVYYSDKEKDKWENKKMEPAANEIQGWQQPPYLKDF